MDSGFLSGVSSETPHVPEQPVAQARPEMPVAAVTVESAPITPEARLESESVQTANVASVVIASPEAAQEAQLTASPTATAIAVPPDKVAEEVDAILKENLDEAITAMPEEAKQRFWQKGKELSVILADMVRRYKVEVKHVLTLLKNWLTSIPGVNRFFLEQEAKIKTDRILELEQKRHEAVPA